MRIGTATLATWVIFASGCGGSSDKASPSTGTTGTTTLSEAQFAKEHGAVCRRYEPRIDKTQNALNDQIDVVNSTGTGYEKAGHLVDDEVTTLKEKVDDLAALPKPANGAGFDAYIDKLREEAVLLSRVREAFYRADDSTVATLLEEVSRTVERVRGLYEGLGLNPC
jgi:hypothetical protein